MDIKIGDVVERIYKTNNTYSVVMRIHNPDSDLKTITIQEFAIIGKLSAITKGGCYWELEEAILSADDFRDNREGVFSVIKL